MNQAITLYVGGHSGTIQKEREDLEGERCFTAAWPPKPAVFANPTNVSAILDSGAFTDKPENRLTPEQALSRQLAWEQKASDKWSCDWQARALVSYDMLIDETWIAGQKHKRRWSIWDAERAVAETVDAANYLASQRDRLAPRTLILPAQGVDSTQYTECVAEVLKATQPGDIFGLGGWCILGRNTRMLPVFWQTINRVLPMVKAASLDRIHIFGVLYLPALGGLLWLADEVGLSVSTDNSRPILDCSFPNPQRAGCRFPYWRDNVAWWKSTLASLRQSEYYRRPPRLEVSRQLSFLD